MNNRVNPVIESSFRSLSRIIRVAFILVILLFILSGITFINPGEVAIIVRFGRLVGDTPPEQIHQPGLKLTMPYIIDEVIRIPVERILEVRVSGLYSDGIISNAAESGYAITGDENIILVNAVAKYQITDPVQVALGIEDPVGILREIVTAAIIKNISGWTVDNVLTREQKELALAVLYEAQQRLDEIDLGVRLVAIEFSHLQPPVEVRSEFDLVTGAHVKKQTMLHEANRYREEIIPAAIAERDETIMQAEAYRINRLSEARRDVALFNGLIEEYRKNPALTRIRVYRDKTDLIMERIGNKTILPPGGNDGVLILP